MQTVLLVEDATLIRGALARLLKAASYQVVCAANGAEALARLKEKGADLILLDHLMPEVDGMTFLSGIRRFPKWKNLPVIMYTAQKDSAAARRAESLGVSGYHVKTELNSEQIIAQVQKALGGEALAATH